MSQRWPMLAVCAVLVSSCGGGDISVDTSGPPGTPTTEVVANTTVAPSTTAPGDRSETELFAGTACGDPVSYTLGGDERIVVARDPSEGLTALMLLDGELFDPEDESAWQTYAASNDTLLLLAFVRPQPATPHLVTAIYDSFFAGRGTGVLVFVEEGDDATIDIISLDLTAQTIEVDFRIPIGGMTSAYPPDFTDYDEPGDQSPCRSGVITGGFSGPFELLDFDEYPGPSTDSAPLPIPTAPPASAPVTTPPSPPLAYAEPIELMSLPGTELRYAFDINNHGMVVGEVIEETSVAVWWPSATSEPERLDGLLGVEDLAESFAIGVNDRGQVLVFARSGLGAEDDRIGRLFVVDPAAGMSSEVMVEFATIGPGHGLDPGTWGSSMNGSGDVVGSSRVPARSFRWEFSTGQAVDVGLLDWALSINDAGLVAGAVGDQPAYWNPMTATVHELSSDGGGVASCINDHGQAAGIVTPDNVTEAGRAVVWDLATGRYAELGLPDVYVHDINERGQILGSRVLGSPGQGSWVWDPSAQSVVELATNDYPSAINDLGIVLAGPEIWVPVD